MNVCRILNKELGKSWKIKRVFYLSKKNKMKRAEFCKKRIEKNIKEIISEKIYYLLMKLLLIWVDMGYYTHDSIKLSDNNKKKLKRETEKLLN